MDSGKTKIIQPTLENIKHCGELLRSGKLVGMPTETVYGLAANALDAEACKSIYRAKGRPLTNPLIAHVHDLDQALPMLHAEIPNVVLDAFKTLAGKFWPGPLTMVVQANMDKVPSLVTAETGFVGLRMPKLEIARLLIKEAGVPLAAPSANKSGHVSPSTAQHVYDDFCQDPESEITILDGGNCSFGIESTVLKISADDSGNLELLVLRQGGISLPQLQGSVGADVVIKTKQHNEFKPETEKIEGPGQFLRHYAPNIDSYLYRGEECDLSNAVLIDFGGNLLRHRDSCKHYIDLSADGNVVEAIGNLYQHLRWAETHDDADIVLIADLLHFHTARGDEYLDALFDKLYRATSGRHRF